MKEKFKVTGMTCSACSSRVEKTVDRLDGTDQVTVNLLTGSMQVEFDEYKITAEQICQAVEKAGYGAFVDGGKAEEKRETVTVSTEDETKKMKRRLIWSVVLLIPLMIFSMGHMVTGNHMPDRPLTNILMQVLFLIPIVALNRKYFVKGIPSLLRGAPNMDSLIAVGSGAAVIYGVFVLLRITFLRRSRIFYTALRTRAWL